MIIYRMMRDNFGGGEIQKIRVNKKKKTLALLENYKSDNDVVNHCDVEDVKKHLNKDYFDYCKGCLKVGKKEHYYILTTKGIKEIKSGYVVTHGGTQFGFNLENGIYFVSHIHTGLLIDTFTNLYELKNELSYLVKRINTTNTEQLKNMRKNFLKELKKFRKNVRAAA